MKSPSRWTYHPRKKTNPSPPSLYIHCESQGGGDYRNCGRMEKGSCAVVVVPCRGALSSSSPSGQFRSDRMDFEGASSINEG